MTFNAAKLKEITARFRAEQAGKLSIPVPIPTPIPEPLVEIPLTPIAEAANELIATYTDRFGKVITYNEKQLEFVRTAAEGKDCVLIGAAGTGKTTCMKGTVNALIENGRAGVLDSDGHKYLISGTPGIVVVAYTRRSVNNIRKNMPEDMQENCITIHKLLEYEPVFYEVIDPETGKIKNKVEFRPKRNEQRPLSTSVRTIVFEESSMVGTDLYREVENAMPHEHQEIFLGDIQQLPPIFGPAILGFKLLELPVVELTEVYRQALESPIIRLAHRILSGIPIPPEELKTMIVPNQLHIVPWSKTITPTAALTVLGNNLPDKNGHLGYFPESIKNGHYDPEQDIILIPQNVGLGTQELNKYIAQFLAHREEREVWEVVAGFNKHYFSVGEKVMYERADGIIRKIETNPMYSGSKLIQEPSKHLTYWGMKIRTEEPEKAKEGVSDAHIDFILTQVAATKDEDKIGRASCRERVSSPV